MVTLLLHLTTTCLLHFALSLSLSLSFSCALIHIPVTKINRMDLLPPYSFHLTHFTVVLMFIPFPYLYLGHISRESAEASLARGQRPSGDLIPWTLSQQFQDGEFPELSGGRVVRIATHPDVQVWYNTDYTTLF